jgi:CHAT domain-containing protein
MMMRLKGNKQTEDKAAESEKKIDALTTELQQLEGEIKRKSPRYAALTQPRPLSLNTIRRQLDAGTLLLEYALGEERSYLWVVSVDALRSYELPKRTVIKDAATKLLDVLTVPKRTVELDAKTQTAAAELSRMLLAPVAARLGKKRLIIVADGALQYIPFAALPKPGAAVRGRGAKNRRGNGGTPLIVDHEIISLPSASTIAVLRRELAGRKPAPKVFAALADPVFSEDEVDERLGEMARATQDAAPAQPKSSLVAVSPQTRAIRALLDAGAGDSEARLRLPRLRASREEAVTIAKYAPPGMSKVALGFEANYATATSPELGEYRHLLFATHGWLDDKHPDLTGIVLSLVDEQKREQNGLLRLGEVYNLKLQAELVTLSACQTALGKDVRGEGLVGLTRGFMYAGAARVVASLWQVEEEGTKELMIRFYREMLRQQLRPAAALRQAQLSMLRLPEWRSPYYWGAFILQGEWK